MLSTRRNIFFINDFQDFWLFNMLIKSNDILIYNSTNKTTSPHLYHESLSNYYKNLIDIKSLKTFENFNQMIMNECDFFITKECSPYTSIDVPLEIRKGTSPVRDKTISIGWLGESTVSYATLDHRYIIKDKYLYHFIERQIAPIYKSFGVEENIIPDNPKYYFLNNVDRNSACKLLSLDPEKEYVTILITKFHEYTKNQIKTLEYIIDYCNKKNIEIVFKTKLKYEDFYKDKVKHQHFLRGDRLYHESLLLMCISNFTIGFSTAASLEAEILNIPFINFWKEEDHDSKVDVDKQTVEFIHKNFHQLASEVYRNWIYRIAQSDNIFPIKESPKYEFDNIKDRLINFIESTKKPMTIPSFDVHTIWKNIIE